MEYNVYTHILDITISWLSAKLQKEIIMFAGTDGFTRKY
jgi:hypothetical protein